MAARCIEEGKDTKATELKHFKTHVSVCERTQARLNESQSHQSQITPVKTCLALRSNTVSERDLIPEQKPHRQKLAMC